MALANQTPPPPPRMPDFLGNRKILIVEDEADIRQLVSLMLSKRGVDSIGVTSAEDALQVLEEYEDEIGLVLLDLSVSNASQTPALTQIKTRYPALPVIIISGLTREDANIDPAYANTVGFLRKPFHPAALYEALGKRRNRRDSGGRERKRSRRDSKEDLTQGT